MSHGFEPIAPVRSTGNELSDHFKVAKTHEQEERSRHVEEAMHKKPSFWKRLFRKS